MVGGDFIEPGGEGAAGVVLDEFVAQLHENLHRGVFRVLLAGKGTSAKAKNGRQHIPGTGRPKLGIPSPSLGD